MGEERPAINVAEDASQIYIVLLSLRCSVLLLKNTSFKYELNIKSVFDVQCSAHKNVWKQL